MSCPNEHPCNFEGSEKKLEIILKTPDKKIRDNTDNQWNDVVNDSRSHMISFMNTPYLDAYLLSESSLFVWNDRVLMITCGKTTLINSVPGILNIIGKENVSHLFYERKNFLFPTEQITTFHEDSESLKNWYPGTLKRFGPEKGDYVDVFYTTHEKTPGDDDRTLQVLMTDLSPRLMEIFSQASGTRQKDVEDESGLRDIFPKDAIIDGYLFTPCGYSANSIYENHYATVHVTPEPAVSFASFETNLVTPETKEQIKSLLHIFAPKRFSVMLTTSKEKHNLGFHDSLLFDHAYTTRFSEMKKELESGYMVSFTNYEKRTG